MPDTTPLPLRVYADTDGKVHLFDELNKWQVDVETPLTEETLEAARLKLKDKRKQQSIAAEGDSDSQLNPQQLANRQIRATLNPPPDGFLPFVMRTLFLRVVALALVAVAVFAIYKGIEVSQERLPQKLHLVVLFLCAVALSLCIYPIATEEIRRREIKRIEDWFGPYGLVLLPFLTLMFALAMFASLTFTLYNNQLVELQPCAGQPVTGALFDFYLWHFLKARAVSKA